MSQFTTPLRLQFIDGKDWKLIESFEFHVGAKNSDEIIVVNSGFITDFASIPRIFWSIIGHPTGKYGKAAVVHDFLYRNGIGSRKKADLIFLEGMEILKVGWLRRRIMYRMVRLFAFLSWRGK